MSLMDAVYKEVSQEQRRRLDAVERWRSEGWQIYADTYAWLREQGIRTWLPRHWDVYFAVPLPSVTLIGSFNISDVVGGSDYQKLCLSLVLNVPAPIGGCGYQALDGVIATWGVATPPSYPRMLNDKALPRLKECLKKSCS